MGDELQGFELGKGINFLATVGAKHSPKAQHGRWVEGYLLVGVEDVDRVGHVAILLEVYALVKEPLVRFGCGAGEALLVHVVASIVVEQKQQFVVEDAPVLEE